MSWKVTGAERLRWLVCQDNGRTFDAIARFASEHEARQFAGKTEALEGADTLVSEVGGCDLIGDRLDALEWLYEAADTHAGPLPPAVVSALRALNALEADE